VSGGTAVLTRPPEPVAEREAGTRWTVDLVLLTALLVLTMMLGRSFSKLAVGGHEVYPTEWFLGAIAIAALWRCGPRGAWARLSGTLPMAVLAVLWVLGAVATLRGLADYGFSLVSHDVGLVEYSVLLPLAALAVDTRERAAALMRVLLYASAASALFYAVARFFPDFLDFAPNPDPAACLYAFVVLAYVATRAVYGFTVSAWLWAVSAVALLIQAAYGGRTGVVAVAAVIAVLAAFAPPRRRLIVAGASIAAFVVALALSGPVTDGIQAVDVRDSAVAQQEQDRMAGGDGGDGRRGRVPAVRALENTFDPNTAGGDSANASWRIDFWRYMVEETADQPLFGVGFGRPAAFAWNGARYDFRQDDPNNPFDYTGPHNSFVNLLYRTGPIALLAVVALLALAARRAWSWWRPERPPSDRATLLQVALMCVFAAAIACFNVALEAPQMGLFFWLPLALLFVLPRVWTRAER